jgi:glycosyltransferase involved in cell wall biosynthesis
MSKALRILHFAPKDCFPANTGAKLRNYYLARELAAKAQVTYLAFADNNLSSHNHFPTQNPSSKSQDHALAPLESFCERVILLPQDNSYSASKIARGLVSRYPLTILNYTTEVMAERLKHLLDEVVFDVVHVESLLLMAYLPIIRAAKNRPLVVCDWHNIDSEVLRRYAVHAPSLARKFYALLTAQKLEKLERESLSLFDGHFVVSDRDRAKLLKMRPNSRIFTADNGVDTNFYSDDCLETAHALWLQNKPPANESKSLNRQTSSPSASQNSVPRYRVLFVGSMDYHANADAVETFAKEIWPAIFKQNPQLKFTIVGRNPSSAICALANSSGVEVTGTVEDVRPFYSEAIAAVVPLRIGGGSRLKILEAMAAGVPVVSTRLGAEGLEVKDAVNILLAETTDDFCRAVSELVQNQILRQGLPHAARSFVRERYDWSAIGKLLFKSYEIVRSECLNSSRLSETFSEKTFEVGV